MWYHNKHLTHLNQHCENVPYARQAKLDKFQRDFRLNLADPKDRGQLQAFEEIIKYNEWASELNYVLEQHTVLADYIEKVLKKSWADVFKMYWNAETLELGVPELKKLLTAAYEKNKEAEAPTLIEVEFLHQYLRKYYHKA